MQSWVTRCVLLNLRLFYQTWQPSVGHTADIIKNIKTLTSFVYQYYIHSHSYKIKAFGHVCLVHYTVLFRNQRGYYSLILHALELLPGWACSLYTQQSLLYFSKWIMLWNLFIRLFAYLRSGLKTKADSTLISHYLIGYHAELSLHL